MAHGRASRLGFSAAGYLLIVVPLLYLGKVPGNLAEWNRHRISHARAMGVSVSVHQCLEYEMGGNDYEQRIRTHQQREV
jgi:hypothetical protein